MKLSVVFAKKAPLPAAAGRRGIGSPLWVRSLEFTSAKDCCRRTSLYLCHTAGREAAAQVLDCFVEQAAVKRCEMRRNRRISLFPGNLVDDLPENEGVSSDSSR